MAKTDIQTGSDAETLNRSLKAQDDLTGTGDSTRPQSDEALSSEEAVRERAHQLWVEAGQPEGQHDQHWEQAEREVRGNSDVDK